ncbi:MAG: NRDE family protein [Xanthomonadales bacterium]|nr:NRDE family protein [Xanthomonadales bacterium]
MCLITFAYRSHPDWDLVVLANRDEFHARPSRPCQWWSTRPVLAGKDLQAGGTWLGVARNGRFAAVTNYREVPPAQGERSRGELPLDFLTGDRTAEAHAEWLLPSGRHYGGFNLLLFDGERCVLVSNRLAEFVSLEPGVHAISNGGLDTAWPKVVRTRRRLEMAIAEGRLEEGDLLNIVHDDRTAPAEQLPDTGIGEELERFLSPPFIRGDRYGTRASTLLWLGANGATLVEHRYGPEGAPLGRTREAFEVKRSDRP